MKHGAAVPIGCVHSSPVIKKHFHYTHVVGVDCRKKRSGATRCLRIYYRPGVKQRPNHCFMIVFARKM